MAVPARRAVDRIVALGPNNPNYWPLHWAIWTLSVGEIQFRHHQKSVFRGRGDTARDVGELPQTDADEKVTTLTTPAGPFKALRQRYGLSRVQVTIQKAREAEVSNLKNTASSQCGMLSESQSQGCSIWLLTASHPHTEMGSDELEFSSCLTHGISLITVTKTSTRFSWKPESGLVMYLCLQIGWGLLGLCIRRTKKHRKKN